MKTQRKVAYFALATALHLWVQCRITFVVTSVSEAFRRRILLRNTGVSTLFLECDDTISSTLLGDVHAFIRHLD